MKSFIRCFLVLILLLATACEKQEFGATEKGAAAGGLVGAGLGAIIGHETGSTGAGIAIGSAVGALTGGVIGNQIDSQNDNLDRQGEVLARQERQIEENRRIIEELKRRGADVRTTERGVVVNLPDVLFEFDSAALRTDALRAVGEIASVTNQFRERRVAVEGHTDSVGTIAYNQRLSEARARSVAGELMAQGVNRSRVTTRGYGETDPIASNRTDLGRSRNRRVEVIIENY